MTPDTEHLDENDLAAAGGTTLTKIAGAWIAMTGAVSAFVAVQVLTSIGRIYSWIKWVPPGMIVLGVVAFFLGAAILKARDWAASAGLVLVPLLAVADTGWLYISFRGGFYSVMCLLSVPFSLAATVLVLFALKDCERASEARRNLAKAGVNLGI